MEAEKRNVKIPTNFRGGAELKKIGKDHENEVAIGRQ